jgi:hypothetical protein
MRDAGHRVFMFILGRLLSERRPLKLCSFWSARARSGAQRLAPVNTGGAQEGTEQANLQGPVLGPDHERLLAPS